MKLIDNKNCYSYYLKQHIHEWETLIILKDDLRAQIEKAIEPALDTPKKRHFLNNLKSCANVGAILDYVRSSINYASRVESK